MTVGGLTARKRLGLAWGCLVVLLLTPPNIGVLLAQSGEAAEKGQFWVQLATGGIVLAIGLWAIREFLLFKDLARQELSKLSFSLMGVDGQGGLLSDAKVNQSRRHEMINQMMAVQEHLYDITAILAKLCEKLDVDFDQRLLKEFDARWKAAPR